MQPFYQGKIDNFCAIYAVLNAVQLLHELSPLQARNIFNLFLIHVSRDERRFWDILTHRTDYVREVDALLDMVSVTHPLRVEAPFSGVEDCREVWDRMIGFAGTREKRAVVFRFRRYKEMRATPSVDHWSTSLEREGDALRLFDCSLEPSGVYLLRLEMLAREPDLPPRECIVIPPEAVRFVSLP